MQLGRLTGAAGTVYYTTLPQLLELRPEICRIACVCSGRFCNKNACNTFRGNGAEQDVRGTCVAKKDDKYNKKGSKSEGPTAESKTYAEDLEGTSTSTRIPQDWIIYSIVQLLSLV